MNTIRSSMRDLAVTFLWLVGIGLLMIFATADGAQAQRRTPTPTPILASGGGSPGCLWCPPPEKGPKTGPKTGPGPQGHELHDESAFDRWLEFPGLLDIAVMQDGTVQPELSREQITASTVTGFAPGESVTMRLWRYDESLRQPIQDMSTVTLQADADGRIALEETIAANMPAGQYVVVACGAADCSTEGILQNLGDPAVVGKAFTIPSLVEDVTWSVDYNMGGALPHLDINWQIPDYDRSRIDLRYYYQAAEDAPYQDFARRSTAFTLGQGTPFEGLKRTTQDDWTSSLYWGGWASQLAPEFPLLEPFRSLLPFAPLKDGAYLVDIYVDGVLQDQIEVPLGN